MRRLFLQYADGPAPPSTPAVDDREVTPQFILQFSDAQQSSLSLPAAPQADVASEIAALERRLAELRQPAGLWL